MGVTNAAIVQIIRTGRRTASTPFMITGLFFDKGRKIRCRETSSRITGNSI
jgi:hypothetical protein